MAITMEDVEKIAKLAKLSFSETEKELFLQQFSRIVHFVEKISELKTEKVSPTTHAMQKWNVLRKDKENVSLANEEIGVLAPKFEDGHIIVPKIKSYE